MNERDRLVKIMESEGMNAKVFSQEVGISAGTLSNILGGRNNPSLEVMQAILRRFRAISSQWLILGEGNMYERENGKAKSIDTNPELPFDTIQPSVDSPRFTNDSTKSSPVTPAPVKGRKTAKVLLFYTDGTFEEFKTVQ